MITRLTMLGVVGAVIFSVIDYFLSKVKDEYGGKKPSYDFILKIIQFLIRFGSGTSVGLIASEILTTKIEIVFFITVMYLMAIYIELNDEK